MKTHDEIRTDVRTHYSAIARGDQTGCCGGGACGTEQLGYSADEIGAAPAGANLGLGCGNPQAIASLTPGETVVDLGAGGGFDAFLAARAVGPTGKVIGVDMSADMVHLARTNATRHGTTNVEFRLGEIEQPPVDDGVADVVMSNCVINLSPDKPAVYREAFRMLRAGGRLAISDVVEIAPMPVELANDVAALCGCVSGAAGVGTLQALLTEIGFTEVSIEIEPGSRELIASWAPGRGFERYVASAKITATRPATKKTAGACCAPGCCA
ncbi:MAG: SAM-dependent methyltransferase [Myxococcales bacterium]|nr:SAM-dependent methyltransferase [Myxococcales bacterium]